MTDFEFRVWVTYELAADDYGVMRLSAAALRSANDAFELKSAKSLERALHRLVSVGLLRTFEHQGKPYVYQHDWQRWQKIGRPARTLHPLPSLESFDDVEESTKRLFTSRLEFEGRPPAVSLKTLDIPSDDATSDGDHLCDSREGLTANGKRLPADGQTLRDRFDRFWESYPRKVGKGGAWREWIKLKPDEALTARMIAAVDVQRQSAQWSKDGGQFVPHPSTWLHQARWLDEEPRMQLGKAIPRGVAEAIEQRRKTDEVNRLIQAGVPREEANRRVFK